MDEQTLWSSDTNSQSKKKKKLQLLILRSNIVHTMASRYPSHHSSPTCSLSTSSSLSSWRHNKNYKMSTCTLILHGNAHSMHTKQVNLLTILFPFQHHRESILMLFFQAYHCPATTAALFLSLQCVLLSCLLSAQLTLCPMTFIRNAVTVSATWYVCHASCYCALNPCSVPQACEQASPSVIINLHRWRNHCWTNLLQRSWASVLGT